MKKYSHIIKKTLGALGGLILSPVAICTGLVTIPILAYKIKRTPEFGLGSSAPTSLLFAILWGVISPIISTAFSVSICSVLASDNDERKVFFTLGPMAYIMQGDSKRAPLLINIKQKRLDIERTSTERLLADFLFIQHLKNQADPNVIKIVKDYLDGGTRICFYNQNEKTCDIESGPFHPLRK